MEINDQKCKDYLLRKLKQSKGTHNHIIYVMRCAIWYHLYNFKNKKKAHGGVLILVKLQA